MCHLAWISCHTSIKFHLPIINHTCICRHDQSCSLLLHVRPPFLRIILQIKMQQFGLLLATYLLIRKSSSLLTQQSFKLLKQVVSNWVENMLNFALKCSTLMSNKSLFSCILFWNLKEFVNIYDKHLQKVTIQFISVSVFLAWISFNLLLDAWHNSKLPFCFFHKFILQI